MANPCVIPANKYLYRLYMQSSSGGAETLSQEQLHTDGQSLFKVRYYIPSLMQQQTLHSNLSIRQVRCNACGTGPCQVVTSNHTCSATDAQWTPTWHRFMPGCHLKSYLLCHRCTLDAHLAQVHARSSKQQPMSNTLGVYSPLNRVACSFCRYLMWSPCSLCYHPGTSRSALRHLHAFLIRNQGI